MTDQDRRRAAVEETAARMNADRAAMGKEPGYMVKFNADGVPYLGLTGGDAPRTERRRIRRDP